MSRIGAWPKHCDRNDCSQPDGKQQTIGTTAFDADRTVYGAAYEYSLSRRSLVHVSLGRSKGSGTLAPTRAATDFANRTELGLGVTHIF